MHINFMTIYFFGKLQELHFFSQEGGKEFMTLLITWQFCLHFMFVETLSKCY